MAHVEGLGCAYCMGIPPPESPSVPHRPSDPNPHALTSHFDREERGCAGVVGMCHLISSPIVTSILGPRK